MDKQKNGEGWVSSGAPGGPLGPLGPPGSVTHATGGAGTDVPTHPCGVFSRSSSDGWFLWAESVFFW